MILTILLVFNLLLTACQLTLTAAALLRRQERPPDTPAPAAMSQAEDELWRDLRQIMLYTGVNRHDG